MVADKTQKVSGGKYFKLAALLSLIFLGAAGCNLFGLVGYGGTGGGGGYLGVLKTLDGGSTWQPYDTISGTTQNNISGVNVSEMSFDPKTSQTVFLGTVDAGLWYSTDAAQTWKQILSKITLYDFFVDKNDSKIIYVSGVYGGHGKVLQTKDGGATWQEYYNEASQDNAVNSITEDPNNNQIIYAGLANGTLIKSVDGGVHWFVLFNFQDMILNIRFGAGDGLYVMLQTKGIEKSVDGGNNWKVLTTPLTQNTATFSQFTSNAAVSSFRKMSIDPQTAGLIYVTTSAGLFKSNDDGVHWLYLNLPVKPNSPLPKAVTGANGGTVVYVSDGSTLFKSLDGGQSWQTQALPTGNVVSKILVDPSNPQVAYLGLLNGQ